MRLNKLFTKKIYPNMSVQLPQFAAALLHPPIIGFSLKVLKALTTDPLFNEGNYETAPENG